MAVNPYDQFKPPDLATAPVEVDPYDQFHQSTGPDPYDQFHQPKGGLARRAADVGISALKSTIAVPEAAVGLADIVTGGRAGKAAESLGFRPKEAKDILDTYLSPEQQRANKAVEDAKGFFPTAGAMLQNPSTIAHGVIESGGLMLGGGMIGRLAVPALKAMGVGAAAPVIGGAAGEGVVGAGAAAEQVRQVTPGGLLDPKQAAAAVGSGIGTAFFGAAGGGLARKLKIADIDTLLAGGKLVAPAGASRMGFTRAMIGGGISEGVFEELPQSGQEQMWQNYANGRPIMESVPEASAAGMVIGGAQGAGVAGLVRPQPALQTPPGPPPGPIGKAAAIAQAAGVAQPPAAPITGATAAQPQPEAAPQSLFGFSEEGAQRRAELLTKQGQAMRVIPHPEREGRFAVIPDEYGQAIDDTGRIEALEAEANLLLERVPGGKPMTTGVAKRLTEIDKERTKLRAAEEKKAKAAPPVEPALDITPPKAASETGFPEAFGTLAGGGITEDFYRKAFDALKAGKTTIAGVKDPVLVRAKAAFDAGTIASPADIARFEQEGYPAVPPAVDTQEAVASGAAPAPDADLAATGKANIDKYQAWRAQRALANERKAHEAATSPMNARPEPTGEQLEANNAKLGHIKVSGLDISIEHPEGGIRRSKPDAKVKWERPVTGAHYGYFKGVSARAADKERVDVFVKPGTPPDHAGAVYVIDQNREDGTYDEAKVLVGFASSDEARQAYLSNYPEGQAARIRGVTELTTEQLQERLNDTKAFLKPQLDAAPLPEPTAAPSQEDAGAAAAALESQATAATQAPEPQAKAVEIGTAPAPAAAQPEAAPPPPPSSAEPPALSPPGAVAAAAAPKLGGKPVTEVPIAALRQYAKSRLKPIRERAEAEMARREQAGQVTREARAAQKVVDKAAIRNDPMLKWIKARGGINSDAAEDITGEKGFVANQMMPGLFKKMERDLVSGLIVKGHGLDEIATAALDAGFLPPLQGADQVDGGVQAMKDKIAAIFRGDIRGTRADFEEETFSAMAAGREGFTPDELTESGVAGLPEEQQAQAIEAAAAVVEAVSNQPIMTADEINSLLAEDSDSEAEGAAPASEEGSAQARADEARPAGEREKVGERNQVSQDRSVSAGNIADAGRRGRASGGAAPRTADEVLPDARAARGASEGEVAPPPGETVATAPSFEGVFALAAQSPEELQAKAEAIKDEADAKKREEEGAERAEKRAREKKEVEDREANIRKERADAAVGGFALGQEAPKKEVSADEVAGQEPMFSRAAIGAYEAETANRVTAWEDAPLNEADYIDEDAYYKALNPYVKDGRVIANSRTTPNENAFPPVGSWRISRHNFSYGREISKLVEIPVEKLMLTELDSQGRLDPIKTGDDVRYAQWLKEGRRAPPIEVVQTDKGKLNVIDGHRRALAAKLSGAKTVEAWVNFAVPIPSGGRYNSDPNMPFIRGGMTFEMLTGKTANPYVNERMALFSRAARTDQTNTPAFRKWFGESKVVDAQGKPLVVYHGTRDDITAFDLDHPNRMDTGWLGTGVYATTDPALAQSYSIMKGGAVGSNVMPLFARLENPFYATIRDKQAIQLISHTKGKEAGRAASDEWTKELQAKGHDGVILDYKAEDVGAKSVSKEIVVFDTAGVKSAVGNRGTFDRKDPNILKSVARGTGSSTVATVEQEIGREGVKGSDRLKIIQSYTNLPIFAKALVLSKKAFDIQGYYDPRSDTAYLIADNIRPGTAFSVLMHEQGVHRGMEGLIGAENFSRLSNQIKLWSQGRGEQDHFDLARRAAARVPKDTPANQRAEELVAYFVEEAVKDGHGIPKPSDQGPLARWFRQLLEAVQGALKKLGIAPESLTTDDIVALARGSLERALAGGKVDPISRPTITGMKSETQGASAKIAEAWEGYDGSGELTIGDLVQEVETVLATEESFPGDDLLQDAVAAYRQEEVDDRALAGRGDMDSAEEAFASAVSAFISRGPALSQPEPSPTFYSALTQAIEGMKQASAPAGIWKGAIANLKGVKADEIEFSGVREFLDLQQGPVTKEALVTYLRENGVTVEETMLGGVGAKTSDYDRLVVELTAQGFEPIVTDALDGDDALVGVTRNADGRSFDALRGRDPEPGEGRFEELPEPVQNILDQLTTLDDMRRDSDSTETRFGQYTLPGGKNYRELLLRLPGKTDTTKLPDGFILKAGQTQPWEVYGADHEQRGRYAHGATQEEAIRNFHAVHPAVGTFRSSHFDQPNILAHVRFNERTDSEGKRVLFIEEIQSDWAQKGKREGFAKNMQPLSAQERQRMQKLEGQVSRASTEQERLRLMEELNPLIDRNIPSAMNRVPTAPFVTKTESWVGLALKRMIRYGAENGFDKISWTTGTQQADRYDLSKHLSRVEWKTRGAIADMGNLVAYDPSGRSVIDRTMQVADLPDAVGKDVADKLLKAPVNHETGQGRTVRRLDGLDLRIGGEGMRKFYDAIVPGVVRDVLKKLGGGRVGEVKIDRTDYGKLGKTEMNAKYAVFGAQPGFDLTPSIAQAAMGGQPMFSRAGSRASWDAPEPGKLDSFIRVMQDRHIDTKRVLTAIRNASGALADSVDVYLQEELYHGRSAKGVQDFLDAELKPLLTEMAARNVTMPDLEQYLLARHAKEANEHIARINPDIPDGGSGMTTGDAQDYLAKLEPAKKMAYEAMAKKVDAINESTRQTLVEYGLESQETINGWKQMFAHYVPLHREDMGSGPGTGQGFSVKGPSTKSRTGSTRTVVDILANIAAQRERAIVRGEKNRVALALYGAAKSNPNPDFWKVDIPPTIKRLDERTGVVRDYVDPLYKSRDNVVMVRMPNADGTVGDHAVVFNEHDERATRMVEALKNLDGNDLGEVLGLSAKITRYFASINTQYNPVFGVVNLIRDFQGALFNLSTTPIHGKQAAVMGHTIAALRGIYIDLRDTRAGKEPTSEWAKLWDEFQREGGQTGFRDLFKTSKDRGEAIEREIKRATEGKAQQLGRGVFDWLSDYNAAMENAVRLSAYRVAKESGMTNQRAASLAKNLTVNFNRKGQIGMQAGSLWAFFNASVQGTARLAETLAGPSGRKIIAGGMTLGAVQALALAAAGFDDDEPPEFVRERNLIIPIGDKKYITIAMPLGLHILPNLSRIPTEYVLSGFRDAPKRLASFVNVFAEAFNPIGNAGLSLQTIAPTAIDPIAALAENKDWTGKPIARKDFNALAPTPGHTRAKDTASAFSKAVSQGLNWISGGTQYKPGIFSPTPDQIDYLIGQVAGGLGREVMKAEQTITSSITGEELPTHKVPLLGRFYGSAAGQAPQANRFYENLRELNEHEAEIKGRRRAGEPIGDYLKENPEARLVLVANRFERSVSELRKRKRALVEKDASREQIKMVDTLISTQMQRMNDQVRQARESRL